MTKLTNVHILLFIIVIYVIIISGNVLPIVIISSLAANYYFLMQNCGQSIGKIDFTKAAEEDPTDNGVEVIKSVAPTVAAEQLSAPDDLYGPDYLRQQAYNDLSLYRPPIADGGNTIDNMAMIFAQKRSRDKKNMDSRALKDKNFYKQYYDEAEFEQQSPWWGANDY